MRHGSELMPRICADRELLASAARRAIEAGLVLASNGRTIQTMREPLPAGWNRVAVTERRPA